MIYDWWWWMINECHYHDDEFHYHYHDHDNDWFRRIVIWWGFVRVTSLLQYWWWLVNSDWRLRNNHNQPWSAFAYTCHLSSAMFQSYHQCVITNKKHSITLKNKRKATQYPTRVNKDQKWINHLKSTWHYAIIDINWPFLIIPVVKNNFTTMRLNHSGYCLGQGWHFAIHGHDSDPKPRLLTGGSTHQMMGPGLMTKHWVTLNPTTTGSILVTQW